MYQFLNQVQLSSWQLSFCSPMRASYLYFEGVYPVFLHLSKLLSLSFTQVSRCSLPRVTVGHSLASCLTSLTWSYSQYDGRREVVYVYLTPLLVFVKLISSFGADLPRGQGSTPRHDPASEHCPRYTLAMTSPHLHTKNSVLERSWYWNWTKLLIGIMTYTYNTFQL